MSNTQQIPSGWYPDPSGTGLDRWWDGTNWSATTRVSPVGIEPYTMAGEHVSSANPNTTFAWVLAAWPLIALLNNVVYAVLFVFVPTPTLAEITFSSNLSRGITVLIALGYVMVAFLDHRELRARGIRPFPWGWGFLAIVYVIGRAVTVYGQTRRGLGPLFVWIGAIVLGWVVNLGIGVAMGLSSGLFSSFTG